METKCKVYIVDDDAALRQMLTLLMGKIGVEVRAYASASEFLAEFSPGACQCLISDMRMPGMGGLELQRRVMALAKSLPIIFISGHAEVGSAVEAMRSGAFDFLQKPFGAQKLLERVQQALERSRELHAVEREQMTREARLSLLTPKERQVVAHVLEGLSSREIGELLGISLRTVENHRARVMEKLHVKSSVELVRLLR